MAGGDGGDPQYVSGVSGHVVGDLVVKGRSVGGEEHLQQMDEQPFVGGDGVDDFVRNVFFPRPLVSAGGPRVAVTRVRGKGPSTVGSGQGLQQVHCCGMPRMVTDAVDDLLTFIWSVFLVMALGRVGTDMVRAVSVDSSVGRVGTELDLGLRCWYVDSV